MCSLYTFNVGVHMNGNESTEETVTRTFRVNKEWDDILHEQAQWQGISVSNLLDQIVRRYVVTERFHYNSPVISMENKAFIRLLQSINEDNLKDLGIVSGKLLPEEELLRRGLPKSFHSFVWMMKEVFGRYGGWFTVDHYTTEDQNVLHLQHYLDRKWSVYLCNFFSSMFRINLDIEAITEIREESVTFYISNKQIETITRAR